MLFISIIHKSPYLLNAIGFNHNNDHKIIKYLLCVRKQLHFVKILVKGKFGMTVKIEVKNFGIKFICNLVYKSNL